MMMFRFCNEELLDYFARFSRFTVISGVLVLTACGGSNSENSSPTELSGSDTSQPETPVFHKEMSDNGFLKTTINGAAVKGVIKDAKVALYTIQEGSADSLLSESHTDDYGHFEFQIPSSSTTDFLIEIYGGDGATMKCDFHKGCGITANTDTEFDINSNGQVDFGEWFTLTNEFVMNAVVAEPDIHSAIHVSPISYLAAHFANSLVGGLTSENIRIANSQTAQVFNLTGNLVSIPAVDLTDSEQLEQADSNSLELATLSASLFSITDTNSLSTTLNQLADTFASQSGQMVTHTETNDVSLSNMTSAASELASYLSLNSVQINHQYNALQASNYPSGSFTVASASLSATDSDLDKAKAIVEDLQTWQSLLKLEGPAASLKEQTEAVREQLAPELIKMQAVLALSSQWAMLPALPELAIESMCNSISNDFIADACHSLVDLEFLEQQCEGGSGLTILGTDLCDLLAEVNLIDNDQYQVVYRFFDGTVSVTGTLLNQSVDLLMSADTLSGNSLNFYTSGTISNDSADLTLTTSQVTLHFANGINIMNIELPESASIILQGELTQIGNEGASFAGTLEADLDLSTVAEQISEAISGTESAAILLASSDLPFQINLTGSLGYGNGEYAEMNLTGNGTENGGHFSIGLSVLSNTMDTEATATLYGTFDDQSMQADSLEMNYIGHTLQMEKSSSDHIVVTNQDGATLTINTALDSGIVGFIEVNNTKFAEIELVNSILYSNFIDDSSHSLFFGF